MTRDEQLKLYRENVLQPKIDFRDAVYLAATELAKRYKGLPDWQRILGHIRSIELEITGETYWGTPGNLRRLDL